MNNTEKLIREKELNLLRKDIRNDKNELKKLISKDFVEYGSSGATFKYDEITARLLEEENEINYRIISMDIRQISENIVLILYTIKMKNFFSNRSSLWKKEKGKWKIIFHQATKIE